MGDYERPVNHSVGLIPPGPDPTALIVIPKIPIQTQSNYHKIKLHTQAINMITENVPALDRMEGGGKKNGIENNGIFLRFI